MAKVYDEPSQVTAEGTEVLLDGPGAVAVSLSPKAAAETSDRLLHAATLALGRQVEAKLQEEAVALRRGARDL